MSTSRRKSAVPIVPPPYWEISSKQVQEELSYAYVHAVGSNAGCMVRRLLPPSYDIDVMISYMRSIRGRQLTHCNLQLQLKASYAAHLSGDFVKFRMESDDYNKLTFSDCDAKLLVLFLMPRDTSQWLITTENVLALKRCAYWLDMRQFNPIVSKGKITIPVPRINTFDVPAVLGPLKTITETWRTK